jgi:hypothetical protein
LPSPPESGERGRVRRKTGVKVKFTTGEFLRMSSQAFWEETGLGIFSSGPAIYATSEEILNK